MAEIKLFEGHVASIKELRQQLSELKDAYAELASQETRDTDKMAAQLNEVAKAQDLLNDVMGNTRNAVSEADRALAQNYNTMQIGDKTVNQLRADLKMLTAVLNDTKPGPGWDQLNQKVLEVNNALKGMEQAHGDFRRSVGSYAKIFDNFEEGADKVQQAGGDIEGALGAITGAMSLTQDQQEELNDALSQFQGALQVIGGAKGVANLLKNLKTWLTTTKAQTTAQKAQNAGINGFTAATKAATVAEGQATVATSLWSAVLNALPFVAIATAIGVLITHFEDIAGWIQKVLEKWGILHKQEEDNVDVMERLTKKFDGQNKELERRQELDKARGVSNTMLLKQQKEQYAQQIKDIEATKAQLRLDIQRLENQSAWTKFWNRSNKKIKEANEDIKALDEMIASLQENMKDIDIDIQVETITEGQNAANNRAKLMEQENEQLKKAAESAASEIKKIYDKTLNPVETIKQTYDEIRKKLKEGEDAELKLAEENQEKITEITEKYSNARSQLAIQETLAFNNAQKEMLQKASAASDKYQEFVHDMANSTRSFRTTLVELFSVSGVSQADNRIYEINRETEKLEAKFKAVLRKVSKISLKDFGKLSLADLRGEILGYYKEMLRDEETFVKKYGQPFSEAIKILGENLQQQSDLVRERSLAFITGMKEDLEKELAKGDTVEMQSIMSQLLGLDEAKNDSYLSNTIKQYVAYIKNEYVKNIMEGGNPLAMNGIFFKWLNEGLKGNIETASIHLSVLKQELSELLPGTDEYLAKVNEMKQAEMELHKARMSQWESWNQVAGKYLETYGKATENLLTNVAGYWGTTLKIKDDNLKKDLEAGKISQQEYDKQHERNRKSFEQMKKLQVAAAVVNTASAIVQALADTTVPSYYVKLANAVAAGLAGAAQIATIKATSLDNAEGGGSSAPQLVDRSATVQVQSMNPMDYQQQNQEPIRVYVTDSDIEEGLNRRRARVEETSF